MWEGFGVKLVHLMIMTAYTYKHELVRLNHHVGHPEGHKSGQGIRKEVMDVHDLYERTHSMLHSAGTSRTRRLGWN